LTERAFKVRQVSDTELFLPAFGFGGVPVGELYRLVSEDEAQRTLEAAWTAGIRYFDTAPWYGRGQSEHRIGRFLRTKDRGSYTLVTKVGRTLHRPANPATFSTAPFAGGLPFDVTFDYSYAGVMRAYEQSLQRLGLNTVDALVIHDLDRYFHADRFDHYKKQLVEGGANALSDLKSAGEISAIGMGFNTAPELAEFVTEIDLDFALVAMPYTLLDQSSLATGMAECMNRNISVVIGSPFASGILAEGSKGTLKYNYSEAAPSIVARVRAMEEICGRHVVALRDAALQFPLAHPAVVSIIPGATTANEVLENLAGLSADIPAAFWSDLKSSGLIATDAPVPR
jgi:D-threo-aldose 1-dehydrogenase